jgi:hypothetical protein
VLEAADPRIVQQHDLLGVPKALDEFGEINRGLDEACGRNDAAAVAALFTEDALLVAPDGMFSGRQNIEKRYADTFQRSAAFDFRSHFCHSAPIETHAFGFRLRPTPRRAKSDFLSVEADQWQLRNQIT